MTGEKETLQKTNAADPLEWFELYGDYLFAFARRRVRDEAAAEDVVQETFLAAIAASASFAGKSSEKAWLTGILKNKIYDYFRRRSRQIHFVDEGSDSSGYHRFFQRDDEWNGHWNPDFAPAEWKESSQFRQVEAEAFRNVLSDCLGGLPEGTANAFVMREIDGLTSEEICGVLMITPNNLWTMMHRARLHLRRCIEIKWFCRSK